MRTFLVNCEDSKLFSIPDRAAGTGGESCSFVVTKVYFIVDLKHFSSPCVLLYCVTGNEKESRANYASRRCLENKDTKRVCVLGSKLRYSRYK